MKVTFLTVGAPKARSLAAAIDDYESRIKHYFSFNVVEIKPLRIPPDGDEGDIPERESEALLDRVPPGLHVVALDRRGSMWRSEELAAYLEELGVLGKQGAAFLIGGALGLSHTALEAADRVLSLSSFTLPHELARLVLAEQVYRSGTIQRGEPYHKGR